MIFLPISLAWFIHMMGQVVDILVFLHHISFKHYSHNFNKCYHYLILVLFQLAIELLVSYNDENIYLFDSYSRYVIHL